ncbi:MAG: carboxypeptidase-like regulatory domain-containing protein [Bacteroidota bacterium]
MRYSLIFMVFCFLQTGSVLGQDSKLLQGKVVAKGKDVVGVAVQNTSAETGTITTTDGSFSIRVQQNDTLVFSAVQFTQKSFVVTKEIFAAEFIQVSLEEFVNALDEVVVRPYNLSGNLDTDLGGLTLSKDVTAEALQLPNAEVKILSQSENKLNDADNGKFVYIVPMGIGINVNKLLNRISGRTKQMKDRIALDQSYAAIQKVEEKYMDSVFVYQLKIPKEKLFDFFHYCQMNETFEAVQGNPNELVMWEFLVVQSKSYRKINSLEDE